MHDIAAHTRLRVTTFEQGMPRLHPNVRCFLLTGQCRCILQCRCYAFLVHVLSFPRIRSPKTNLTIKRAMRAIGGVAYRTSRFALRLVATGGG